jgi:hypothetical protein
MSALNPKAIYVAYSDGNSDWTIVAHLPKIEDALRNCDALPLEAFFSYKKLLSVVHNLPSNRVPGSAEESEQVYMISVPRFDQESFDTANWMVYRRFHLMWKSTNMVPLGKLFWFTSIKSYDVGEICHTDEKPVNISRAIKLKAILQNKASATQKLQN